jgi:hypothetical protein
VFGSQILDIAIAMILFYLFISLICSAIREGIEALMKVRAMNLERGIRELLNDPSGTAIVKDLFNHPQLSGLFTGEYKPEALKRNVLKGVLPELKKKLGWWARSDLPSYIPASNFAVALLDITANGPLSDKPDQAPPPPLSLDTVRSSIATLPNSQVQRAILNAVDRANGDLATAQKNLEDWFNSGMDRVSGWYKRRTQLILFVLGFVAAVALNLDTFAALDVVNTNKSIRDQMVATAEGFSRANATAASAQSDADKAKALATDLDALHLPLGWKDFLPVPQSVCPSSGSPGCGTSFWTRGNIGSILKMILGWLITAAAVTLGAPFWFDLLSKFIQVRSTLKPEPAKKASDQPANAPPPPPPPPPAPMQPAPPPLQPFQPHEWNQASQKAAQEGDL